MSLVVTAVSAVLATDDYPSSDMPLARWQPFALTGSLRPPARTDRF